MKRLLSILLLLIALIGVTSCHHDDDVDRSYTDYRYDIVTYQGQNAIGAVFEYLGHGDTAAIKLQSTVAISTGITANQRVLLRYEFADRSSHASTRNVTVYGCYNIISDSLRYSTAKVSDYPMHEMKLRSLWRTGQYINMHAQVEYTGEARMLVLAADSTTLNQDTVHCYLMHDLRGYEGTYWRDCYGSFFVGILWQKPSCRVLRVHVNDVVRPENKYYDFIK